MNIRCIRSNHQHLPNKHKNTVIVVLCEMNFFYAVTRKRIKKFRLNSAGFQFLVLNKRDQKDDT